MRKLLATIIIIGIIINSGMLSIQASSIDIDYTTEELKWIEDHKNQVLHVGLAPYEGIDLFLYRSVQNGYLSHIVDMFMEETNLEMTIDKNKPWKEAYDGLVNGSIDILFGANPTEERLKFMSFTDSVYHYPYVVLAKKDSDIYTIGDLDSNPIGFIEGDMVIALFQEQYENIDYTYVEYADPETAIEALIQNEVKGFITANTEIITESLYAHNEVKKIAELNSIFSEMTFSTRKENSVLAGILDKIIQHKNKEINEVIDQAKVTYMYKILDLSQEEQQWIEAHPILKVGAPTDYLPIDYYNENGEYEGVAGAFLNEFADMIGIRIEAIPGTFDELYKKAMNKDIDLLNMAKTEDRLQDFIFTTAFSNDRDMIYGLKTSTTVYDIYGLENKKVAVIDGFWHEEYLKKNLKEVSIIYTRDIHDTLRRINSGEVDYFIENQAVAEYYIEGLGYLNVVSKGKTSSDSYLYFGVQKEHEAFVTIFDRARKLMDYEKARYLGIQSSPDIKNVENSKLILIISLIIVLLLVLLLVLIRILRAFVYQKAQTNILKEREHLIYTDALTGIYNRVYFNSLEKDMNAFAYPQAFIMMDLNYLKSTNDTYGHKVGDLLIQEFANVLKRFIPHDKLMRMGGDEFFAFLDHHQEEAVLTLIEKIKYECKNCPILLDDGTVLSGPVAAIGYVIRENDDMSPEYYLHRADQNMYEDKKKLKNKEV